MNILSKYELTQGDELPHFNDDKCIQWMIQTIPYYLHVVSCSFIKMRITHTLEYVYKRNFFFYTHLDLSSTDWQNSSPFVNNDNSGIALKMTPVFDCTYWLPLLFQPIISTLIIVRISIWNVYRCHKASLFGSYVDWNYNIAHSLIILYNTFEYVF